MEVESVRQILMLFSVFIILSLIYTKINVFT